MNTQLAFHEHQFNVISHNSQIWLTSSDLASALQYKNEKSITNLFNKNFDEFTPGMSEVIESVTSEIAEVPKSGISGNLRVKVRIFSLRGAHLIAMFARTPVAKEFRRWILDVLDREVGTPVITPVPSSPVYPEISDDYANRTEMIYYQDFKPIFCRVLKSDDIVMSSEAIMNWLESKGLLFFTREELRDMTHEQWLKICE